MCIDAKYAHMQIFVDNVKQITILNKITYSLIQDARLVERLI